MSKISAAKRQCSKPDCEVATTSLCLEGLSLDDCPHLTGLAAADSDEAEDEFADSAPAAQPIDSESDAASSRDGGEDNLIDIGGEGPLDVENASRLLRRKPASVIAIVGPAEAGKTCLISCVYDTFQYGGYKSLRFSGSQTLMAFEQICHSARAASQAGVPHEDRTSSLDEIVFYHLSVQDREAAAPRDFLLADRSGELYDAVANQPSLAKTYVEFEHGVVVNVLVDGRGLCDSGERHAVSAQARSIVDALAASVADFNKLRLNLVLTKYDLVAASEQSDRAMEDFNALTEEIKAAFGGTFASITPYVTAASPQIKGVEKGYGVEDLIRSWLAGNRRCEDFAAPPVSASRSMGRL